MTPHDRRRFVEKLDFMTTPGYLTGSGAREAAGLPAGTGPYKVVTNLAVLGYDDETKRMCVESVHPGTTLQQVRENTGFDLLVSESIEETPEPDIEALRILREEVDPQRLILGRA
jgi:glutaconate CoA-transferase subunit B